MKQILVISGKGGTGKTIITGALAVLAENAVIADCDVDAADLHLLLQPKIKEKHVFKSGVTAFIDKDKCTGCGVCAKVCRFKAISADFIVDPVSCEGCAFCSFVCPVGAITLQENISGEWYISDTRSGTMVHAKLGIAEENSGKLVALIKKKANEIAAQNNAKWTIIDGAPGIGCPVIASLSGVDCALVVTEPSLSGLHDADRVIRVAGHFGISVKVAINKYDLNTEMTRKIEKYCRDKDIEVIGKILFDKSVVEAMVDGKTIIEHGDGKAKEEVIKIWRTLSDEIHTPSH